MALGCNAATYPNCGKLLKTYKEYCVCIYKSSAISGSKMSKQCCKCKKEKVVECFGKLANSPDGLRYDCKSCRKEYRDLKKDHIKEKNTLYYESHKNTLLEKNKEYRETHKESIFQQRKEYRSRDEVKMHIKTKQKEYLPVRKLKIQEKRKTDLHFQMSEVLRSKIHKFLKNRKTSYTKYIGCDVEWFKKWIEFRFDTFMNWDNFGSYWQIDHILPINGFDLTNENDVMICFHWTNLQPLSATENRQKSNKLLLHYYFNNIVNVTRFNKKYTQYLGYQVVNESLQWLRKDLRYGKNPPYEAMQIAEVDNPQPSL